MGVAMLVNQVAAAQQRFVVQDSRGLAMRDQGSALQQEAIVGDIFH